MLEDYVAIDLETTGLDPKRDKIIEIGAVKVKKGEVVQTFSMFVNPRRKLKTEIIALTGIVDDDLVTAPDIDVAISQLLEFCGEAVLVGHHLIFDYSFLKRAALNHGHTFERQGIDTLKLCRQLMPPDCKKSLQEACRFYQIEQPLAHRALADACTTHALYQTLLCRHGSAQNHLFTENALIYQIKREQPGSKRQKEYLRDLLKYHRIETSVQIDFMTRNELSRLTDQIILQYGKMIKR